MRWTLSDHFVYNFSTQLLQGNHPSFFGIPFSMSQEVVQFNISVVEEAKYKRDSSYSNESRCNQPQDETEEETKGQDTTQTDENPKVIPKSKKEPPIHALLERSIQIETLENLSEQAAKQVEFLIMNMEDSNFKDRILSLSAQGEELINGLNVLVQSIVSQIEERANDKGLRVLTKKYQATTTLPGTEEQKSRIFIYKNLRNKKENQDKTEIVIDSPKLDNTHSYMHKIQDIHLQDEV